MRGGGWSRTIRALPGYGLASLVKNIVFGGDDRATALLRWRSPAGLLQPSGFTSPDRYPNIFRELSVLLADRRDPRILSYGCSYGDEIETILRYFPAAQVKGIDIDLGRVAQCRKRFSKIPTVAVDRASSARAEPVESYDVVLAMAVLRHGDLGAAPPSSHRSFRYADFLAAVVPLLQVLKPGGLLVTRHANFRVLDAAGSLATCLYSLPASGPIYGPDNRLSDDPAEAVIVRKC